MIVKMTEQTKERVFILKLLHVRHITKKFPRIHDEPSKAKKIESPRIATFLPSIQLSNTYLSCGKPETETTAQKSRAAQNMSTVPSDTG